MEQFLRDIALADGRLLSLERQSRVGEPLTISARIGDSPHISERLVLIDLFAQRNDQQIAIGHRDWIVQDGQVAFGHHNRHGGHLPTPDPAHQTADQTWSTSEAVKVDGLDYLGYAGLFGNLMSKMTELRQTGVVTSPEQWSHPIYQKYGLGSFMNAVSLYVFKQHGIEQIRIGQMSETAEKMWSKVGVLEQQNYPIQPLLTHPHIQTVLARFILP